MESLIFFVFAIFYLKNKSVDTLLFPTVLPAYKECGNAYSVKSGKTLRLQSNGYPNGYEFYSFCTYRFETAKDTRVNLAFYDFNLEEIYDYIEVGNGNDPSDRSSVIGRFDGSMMPGSILADSNTMWIFFYADYSVSGKGFSVGVTANNPGKLFFPVLKFCFVIFFSCCKLQK